jgi:tetratricopeptide (TPR) repeat protein
LDFYNQALALLRQLDDKRTLADVLNNIGVVHDGQGHTQLALDYYRQSYALELAMDNPEGQASSLINIGIIHMGLARYDSANYYMQGALHLNEELDDPYGIAYSLRNLGLLAQKQQRWAEAIRQQEQALAISQEHGYRQLSLEIFNGLSTAYTKVGNYRQAWEYERQYTLLNDTLFNARKADEMAQLQQRFDTERHLAQEEARRLREEAQTQARNNLQYTLIMVGIIGVVLGVLFASRLHLSRRLVNALVFMSVLLFFEFILVFLDPVLEPITMGVPVYKLGINMLLATGILFLHNFLEGVFRRRVEKLDAMGRTARFGDDPHDIPPTEFDPAAGQPLNDGFGAGGAHMAREG